MYECVFWRKMLTLFICHIKLILMIYLYQLYKELLTFFCRISCLFTYLFYSFSFRNYFSNYFSDECSFRKIGETKIAFLLVRSNLINVNHLVQFHFTDQKPLGPKMSNGTSIQDSYFFYNTHIIALWLILHKRCLTIIGTFFFLSYVCLRSTERIFIEVITL